MINGSIFHLPFGDKKFHTIIFSPPYYGLRDYGLAPIIIGGELDCVHEWGSEKRITSTPHTGLKELSFRTDGRVRKHHRYEEGATAFDTSQGSFCLNCNAWRGSLGLEPTPELFIEHCRIYAKECWRVLRDDGTMWVNIGGSYGHSGKGSNKGVNSSSIGGGQDKRETAVLGFNTLTSHYKPKDLIPTPWLFAIALQQDGWYLRSDIIWHKPNPMQESTRDRPTRSHEYVFLFSKSRRYFYDADAVREGNQVFTRKAGGYSNHHNQGASRFGGKGGFGDSDVTTVGRNLRSVWTIPTHGFSDAHFATFPPKLIEPMIKAGTSEGGICIKCGSQFERVVNKERTTSTHNMSRVREREQGKDNTLIYPIRYETSVSTLGFRPTCIHYDHLEHDRSDPNWIAPLNWPRNKAIVLDPFGGAGTTQLVATRLGRHCISVELSFDYCKMGRDRTANDIPPMIELIERVKEPNQLEMFE